MTDMEDYDLFDSDDDQWLMTAINTGQDANPRTATAVETEMDCLDFLPELNCKGKQMEFPKDSFVANGYALKVTAPRSQLNRNTIFAVTINELRNYQVLENLINGGIKQVMLFFRDVIYHQRPDEDRFDWYVARKKVTHIYHIVLHDSYIAQYWSYLSRHFIKLRELLDNELDMKGLSYLYAADSNYGNQCNKASFHLYHGLLEWRFLDFFVMQKYEPVSYLQSTFYSYLESFLDDLLIILSFDHRARNIDDLQQNTDFKCNCMKEIWLLLQHLVPLWLKHMPPEDGLNFWVLYNNAMVRYKDKLDRDSKLYLKYFEFNAWLRLCLLQLNVYTNMGKKQEIARSSLPQQQLFKVVSNLEEFMTFAPNEFQRRVYIALLVPVQLKLAHPSLDMLYCLWEHMNRLLNFNLQPPDPQFLPRIYTTGKAYVERYSQLIENEVDFTDKSLSSFTLFVLMLAKTLQLPEVTNQTHKVVGRIFSKFSASKLLTLNEFGLHHLLELFICMLLAHPDFTQLAPKLREMMLSLTLEKLKPERRKLVVKGHMALLQLHAQHLQPMDEYVLKLQKQFTAISSDTDLFGIIAAGLQPIFECAANFSCGEHLLLGPWLAHYLEKVSAQAQADRVWEALIALCVRLRLAQTQDSNATNMWEALSKHLLPTLRSQYATQHGEVKSHMLAEFCLYNNALLNDVLENIEPVDFSASGELLLYGLNNGLKTSPAVIIHVWIKMLVLSKSNERMIKGLMAHVIKLDDLQSLGSTAVEYEREPLCTFFRALGKYAVERAFAPNLRMQLSQKLHSYLARVELWLPLQRLRTESMDLVTRFYSFLAAVIYNCSMLAYVRSKPTCFLHITMSHYFLPAAMITGTPPDPRLPHIMHKIFTVLVQGIGRMPFKTDRYLGWCLQQLLLRWMPTFKVFSIAVVARPFFQYLQKVESTELAEFILTELAQQNLAVTQGTANKNASFIIRLLQYMIAERGEENVPEEYLGPEMQLETLLKAVHIPLLEHLMFANEFQSTRLECLNLYMTLHKNKIFAGSDKLHNLCHRDIKSLLEKHLAHCTFFTFQMLIKLAEQKPDYIAPLMSFIESEAMTVQIKRGAGEDVGIHKCLRELRQAVKSKTPKLQQ